MGWRDTIQSVSPQAAPPPVAQAAPSWRDTIVDRDPAVQEQGVTDSERFKIKSLVPNEPEVAANFLQKNGYETRIVDGNVQVRKPGDQSFKVIDPDKFSFKEMLRDLTDVAGDVAQVGAETAAEIIPGRFAPAGATAVIETGKQLIAKKLGVRDEMNPTEIGVQTGLTAAMPSVVRVGGKAIKATAGGLSDVIGYGAKKLGFMPKENAAAIVSESGKLGMKVTPAQVIEGKTVSNMQDSLQTQTFSIPGASLRKKVEESNKIAQKVAEDIVSDRSMTKANEAGFKASAELVESVHKQLGPAEAIYQKYEDKFKFIKPALKDFKENISSLKDKYQYDKSVMSTIKEVEELMPAIKDLNELKKIRSTVGNMLRKADHGTDERYVLNGLYRELTEVRSASLLKRAKGEPESFYNIARQEIKAADQMYKDSFESVENVMGRGRRVQGSPKEATKQFVEKNKPFDIPNKIFDVRDPARLIKLKADHPEVFETLRRQKLEDIAKASQINGQISFKKLAKAIDVIPDASAEMLIGKDKVLKVRALKTIAESIPQPANPSGSGDKMIRELLSLVNPITYLQAIAGLSKSALLDIISNPVTRQGFLNNIANSSIESSKAVNAAARFGVRQTAAPGNLTDWINQKTGQQPGR